jgi:transcription elongation factor Elf1
MSTEPKKLNLMPYNVHNSIVVICKRCGCEFEETAGGYYEPIEYESDYYDRECRRCLTELGKFS